MTDRPLLFLDVDGVLNCMEGDHPAVEVLEPGEFDMPVFLPDGVPRRVTELLKTFEPVWATAWRGCAHRAWRKVFDLGASWPYLDWVDLKLPEIIRHAKGRPFVWIDDDAEWELRELGWDRSMVDGLILQPDPAVGLADEHVGEAVAWAAEGP